jgi:hypothetical protein
MTGILPASVNAKFWSWTQVQPSSLAAGKESKVLRERLRAMQKTPPSAPEAQSEPGAQITERLFDASAQLKILVSRVSMHLSDDWRRRLFRKLDSLHDPDNWEQSDTLIDPGSFMNFLRLILQIGLIDPLSLGVSPEGHFLTGWVRDKDSLTLEFTGGDEIRWALVRYLGDHRESAAGRTLLERLPAVLKPYSPETWFQNANEVSSGS